MTTTWNLDPGEETITLRPVLRPPRPRPRHRPRFLQIFTGYPGRHARKAGRAWT